MEGVVLAAAIYMAPEPECRECQRYTARAIFDGPLVERNAGEQRGIILGARFTPSWARATAGNILSRIRGRLFRFPVLKRFSIE